MSARRVATITEPGYHADGGGLYLRVPTSGTRGWIYRYQLQGRRRDMGLGRLDDASLAEARANPDYGKEKIAVIIKRDNGRPLSGSTVGRILKHLA